MSDRRGRSPLVGDRGANAGPPNPGVLSSGSGPALPIPPILAAALAAVVGAVAWGVIAVMSGYEVGYVAWGIGALVGFAASLAGGRGNGLAWGCALLTLAAIFGGKMLSFSWSLDGVVDEVATQEGYAEFVHDVEGFQRIDPSSDAELHEYMVEYGYTPQFKLDGEVGPALAEFREAHQPRLTREGGVVPSYDEWRGEVRDLLGEIPVMDAVTEDLAPMDLLFALLGVLSAFKMAGGGKDEGARPRRLRGRA